MAEARTCRDCLMPEIHVLREFLIESNRIEGIPAHADIHIKAAGDFLETDEFTVDALCSYVHEITNGRELLREKPGMNVRVGDHRPIPGGPLVANILRRIMSKAAKNLAHPYLIHHEYETLHPFMDGNGRSGRLLWAWQMLRFGYKPGIDIGFLHAYYYQSLQFWRKPNA